VASTYFSCKKFLLGYLSTVLREYVRREFVQHSLYYYNILLSIALHCTLGSYLRDALQEGSADAVACLPVKKKFLQEKAVEATKQEKERKEERTKARGTGRHATASACLPVPWACGIFSSLFPLFFLCSHDFPVASTIFPFAWWFPLFFLVGNI
jgi:hypothetical protein